MPFVLTNRCWRSPRRGEIFPERFIQVRSSRTSEEKEKGRKEKYTIILARVFPIEPDPVEKSNYNFPRFSRISSKQRVREEKKKKRKKKRERDVERGK